jgi:ABC-type multidrug transport system fused ATPase/permease subunit
VIYLVGRRAEVFDRIISRELDFFDKEEVGTLTSRLGADCQSVARLIGFHINVMLRNFMQCIGAASSPFSFLKCHTYRIPNTHTHTHKYTRPDKLHGDVKDGRLSANTLSRTDIF